MAKILVPGRPSAKRVPYNLVFTCPECGCKFVPAKDADSAPKQQEVQVGRVYAVWYETPCVMRGCTGKARASLLDTVEEYEAQETRRARELRDRVGYQRE